MDFYNLIKLFIFSLRASILALWSCSLVLSSYPISSNCGFFVQTHFMLYSHLLHALQAKDENNCNIKQEIKLITVLFDYLFLKDVLLNKSVQNSKGNVWCFFYPTINAVFYQVLSRQKFHSK